jgi:hypothetical protein
MLIDLPVTSTATADDWPDFPDDFDTGAVNEGELEFLASPPDTPVHTHHNRISLTAASLVDGWAHLYQCHTHLDPVPAAEIVFRPGRIRQLQVARHAGIDSVRVEGNSVQLEAVTPGAELCLSAESRVVVPQPDGGFLVRNGPFMRSFLDGFYPMHVLLEISLPPGRWTLLRSEPAPQPGFTVVYHAGKISVDAWFSGQLHTGFYFAPDHQAVTESPPDKEPE